MGEDLVTTDCVLYLLAGSSQGGWESQPPSRPLLFVCSHSNSWLDDRESYCLPMSKRSDTRS